MEQPAGEERCWVLLVMWCHCALDWWAWTLVRDTPKRFPCHRLLSLPLRPQTDPFSSPCSRPHSASDSITSVHSILQISIGTLIKWNTIFFFFFCCYPQWQNNGWTSRHSLGWSTESVLFGFAWVSHGQGSKIESVSKVEWVAREKMDGLLIWSVACGPWLSTAGSDRLNRILATVVCWQSLFLTPISSWNISHKQRSKFLHTLTDTWKHS